MSLANLHYFSLFFGSSPKFKEFSRKNLKPLELHKDSQAREVFGQSLKFPNFPNSRYFKLLVNSQNFEKITRLLQYRRAGLL